MKPGSVYFTEKYLCYSGGESGSFTRLHRFRVYMINTIHPPCEIITSIPQGRQNIKVFARFF